MEHTNNGDTMEQEDLMEVIAKNVRHFRIENSLSQLELEHIAGLGENSLTNIEMHKTSDMNISTLNKISKALGVNIKEFFIKRSSYQNKNRIDERKRK